MLPHVAFGSTAEIQQLPRSGSFTPPIRRSGGCFNRMLSAVGRYSASAASWSETSGGQLGEVFWSTKSSSTIKWKHRRALAEGLIIRR
jgi:hypothetical protein